MALGLSLEEQVAEFKAAGGTWRTHTDWAGQLEAWLEGVLPPGAYERYDWLDPEHDDREDTDGPADNETALEWTDRRRAGVQTWSFPTRELRDEYLATIARRRETDILALLRLFLFEESCFARDSHYLHLEFYTEDGKGILEKLPTEYRRRLLHWIGRKVKPHPSIRWVLDLLPHAPQQAIDAIRAYLNVYWDVRPSGRSDGLRDAMAIIRARWIEDLTSGTEALFRLSPRDLEVLAAALYRKLGYAVELTPPSRDGGRDVIATKAVSGQRDVVEIECKAHTSPVGVAITRQLQGVVAQSGATRGVLITTSSFTRGARAAERDDPRLELVDGPTLIRMLNAVFGPQWTEDQAWICEGLD